MTLDLRCWCGNAQLIPFSPGYARCDACDTLVSDQLLAPHNLLQVDDERDFYGRRYYESHLVESYQYPTLTERVRTDLPERCLHWLQAVLKYKLPPGRILELGSAHGGFVALLRWANFDASGLEVSPWLARYSREAFQIPVLLGPLDVQDIAPGSLDAIALMDVLEHLPDPVQTVSRGLELLRHDGVLIVQTPCLPEQKSFEQMKAEGHAFLQQLKREEHLYLFSQRSVQEFFRRLGAKHFAWEPAIFSHYDMFFVVGRSPLQIHPSDEIDSLLGASPDGKMMRALLDLHFQLTRMTEKFHEAETDRAARLKVIERLGQEIHQLENSPLLLAKKLFVWCMGRLRGCGTKRS